VSRIADDAFFAHTANKAPMALRLVAPLALMGLIFYLSAQSDPGADVGTVGRILAHAGEYALLGALWTWALAPALGIRRALAAAVAISFLYAISDEIHQSSVPGRDADPLDVVADTAGIAIAALLIRARLRGARTIERAPRNPRSSAGG
jgi:VanZ family protein